MTKKEEKKKRLSSLKTKRYRIYGIFNFNTSKLVFVHMDKEKVIFEFDLEGYDEATFDVIAFEVWLS